MDERLSQLLSHPLVLNMGPLDWESSALATTPFSYYRMKQKGISDQWLRQWPLPKHFYKNYTKCIQKLYKTLYLYMFGIQRLYKSKFCMIMNAQKMSIKFLLTYKKTSRIQVFYKTCTKYRLKTTWNLKCMHFVHTNNVQTIQNL